jgi:hypothetical protein
MSEPISPSSRRIYEQSWWIGSELARRQSRLRLIETHFGGIYDELRLIPDIFPYPNDGTISMNRAGSIHTFVGDDPDGPANLTWADALAAESPHEIVRELERRMGWNVTSADPTTPRTLAYRAISSFLTRTINERESWMVRQLEPDNGWLYYPEEKLAVEFPTVGSAYGDLAQGRPGLWAMLREEKVTLVVGEDGRLHRREEEVVDLMPVYQKRKRIDDVVELMLDA